MGRSLYRAGVGVMTFRKQRKNLEISSKRYRKSMKQLRIGVAQVLIMLGVRILPAIFSACFELLTDREEPITVI